MDPIIGGIILLSFVFVVPVLLVSVTLKTYLSAIGLLVFGYVVYLWLLEHIAPSPSASRLQASYGLCQVYPSVGQDRRSNVPAQETENYSIIFVHGLGANPATTWTAEDGSSSCCWITDLLPTDLRDANIDQSVRLCTFNYHSFWVRNSSMSLRATAVSLLQEIQNIQTGIILVGHSFGGLIIKQTLVIRPEMKARIRGVVFLGTPHQGTSYNRFGLLASYLLLPLDPDIEIMRILAPDSDVLDGLQKDFENHCSNLVRKYFYETRKTQRKVFGFIPILQEFVVRKSSATLGSSEMNSIKLETDHRGLNKFSERSHGYKSIVEALTLMVPQPISIPASAFKCHEVDCPDADFPGRFYWYREKVTANGYPAHVQVDPEYAHQKLRPIGDTILTCRRTTNVLIRHRLPHVVPGLYHVKWIFWFWAGRDFPDSTNRPPQCYIPRQSGETENSVCERFFPAAGTQGSASDSSYFYPWTLRCSAGMPQDYEHFLHTDIDPRPHKNPLAAPVLLKPGFVEKEFEAGYWRTMKNIGWFEVKDQSFRVGSDGEIAFVIGNLFIPHWLGGFAFGGLKLEPVL